MAHPLPKITDYHRFTVTKYYATLMRRFGRKTTLRYVGRLSRIVWTIHGFALVEKHVGANERPQFYFVGGSA